MKVQGHQQQLAMSFWQWSAGMLPACLDGTRAQIAEPVAGQEIHCIHLWEKGQGHTQVGFA
jgi:hypothetical protein